MILSFITRPTAKRRSDLSLPLRNLNLLIPMKPKKALLQKKQLLMVKLMLCLRPKPTKSRQLVVLLIGRDNERASRPFDTHVSFFHYIYQEGRLLTSASNFTMCRFVQRLDAVKAYIPLARN